MWHVEDHLNSHASSPASKILLRFMEIMRGKNEILRIGTVSFAPICGFPLQQLQVLSEKIKSK
jgi:hypothetical protein